MILVGFLGLYYTKGFSMLVPNLQGLASNFVGQVQTNWQNLALAAVGVAVVFIVHKLKIPGWAKAVILLGLYATVGYELGLFVDPPGGRTDHGKELQGARSCDDQQGGNAEARQGVIKNA